ASYTYNAQGQRAIKTTPTSTTYYDYDLDGALIGEYDETGQAIKEYVHVNGEPVAQLETSGITYLHTDHLATPRKATNEAGDVVWEWDSEAFGNEVPMSYDGTEVNLRFPGQVYDVETGLYYNYFRYYDSGTGRYITSDPIGLNGGLNTFAYVNGNPIGNIDPFGLRIPQPGQDKKGGGSIYNDIRDMRIKGHQKYPGEKNSAMRHCVVSCMVAKKYGIPMSAAAGTVNEYQGFYMHDLPNIKDRFAGGQWAFQPEDFADNYRGYNCSQEDPGACGKDNESPETTCARCCGSN
ncbi:MAG: hypothetical protein GY820_42785, partial [Gammaproteobacteria bacterium]|nr:hypothetical protein [Gammaproteobacteria bacterium]